MPSTLSPYLVLCNPPSCKRLQELVFKKEGLRDHTVSNGWFNGVFYWFFVIILLCKWFFFLFICRLFGWCYFFIKQTTSLSDVFCQGWTSNQVVWFAKLLYLISCMHADISNCLYFNVCIAERDYQSITKGRHSHSLLYLMQRAWRILLSLWECHTRRRSSHSRAMEESWRVKEVHQLPCMKSRVYLKASHQ